MKAELFLLALLAAAGVGAAESNEEGGMEVALRVFFDLGGDEQPYVMKLGKEPKTFTLKNDEREQLSLKLTQLDDCRVSVEILQRDNVTVTRPLSWPAFFEPGATFSVGVHFPRHRQEVRGSVSGTGACSRPAPDKPLEPYD